MAVNIITVAFFVVYIVFGLPVNTLLNYLIFTRKDLRERQIFIASISISHIMLCVGAIPLAISASFTEDIDSDVVRTACDVLTCFSVGVTSHSTFVVAIRRRMAICERFRHINFTFKGKVENVICIWIVSLALSMPYIANQHTINVFDISSRRKINLDEFSDKMNTSSPLHNTTYGVKTETLSKDSIDSQYSVAFLAYNIILFFLNMLVPSVSSICLQTATLFGLKRRPNQANWVKEITVTKQYIAMSSTFLICWFPLMIANLVGKKSGVPEVAHQIFRPLALSVLISCPVIYYCLNPYLKREFILFKGHFCSQE